MVPRYLRRERLDTRCGSAACLAAWLHACMGTVSMRTAHDTGPSLTKLRPLFLPLRGIGFEEDMFASIQLQILIFLPSKCLPRYKISPFLPTAEVGAQSCQHNHCGLSPDWHPVPRNPIHSIQLRPHASHSPRSEGRSARVCPKWKWWDVLLVARPLHYRDLKTRLKRLSRRSLQLRIRQVSGHKLN